MWVVCYRILLLLLLSSEKFPLYVGLCYRILCGAICFHELAIRVVAASNIKYLKYLYESCANTVSVAAKIKIVTVK
jgi:hypothetical protein